MASLLAKSPSAKTSDWYRVPFVNNAVFQCENSECDRKIWSSRCATYHFFLAPDQLNDLHTDTKTFYITVICFSQICNTCNQVGSVFPMEDQLAAIVMLLCNRLAFMTLLDMNEVKLKSKKSGIYQNDCLDELREIEASGVNDKTKYQHSFHKEHCCACKVEIC